MLGMIRIDREVVRRRGKLRRRRMRGTPEDLVRALDTFARHTGLPTMVTETSDNAPVERRLEWMRASTAAVEAARRDGMPVAGYTWFPVFSHVDWRWLRGPHDRSAYWCHMGLWDLDDDLGRHRTRLADEYAALIEGGSTMPWR